MSCFSFAKYSKKALLCSAHFPSNKDKSTLYQSPSTAKLSMRLFQRLFKPRSACTSVVQHEILQCVMWSRPFRFRFCPHWLLTRNIYPHSAILKLSSVSYQSVQTKNFRKEIPGSMLDLNYSPLARLMCLSLSLIQTFSVGLGHRVNDWQQEVDDHGYHKLLKYPSEDYLVPGKKEKKNRIKDQWLNS